MKLSTIGIMYLVMCCLLSCHQQDNKPVDINNCATKLYIVKPYSGTTPQDAWMPDTKGVIIYKTAENTASFGYVTADGKEHNAHIDDFPGSVTEWQDIESSRFVAGAIIYEIDVVISGIVYVSENTYHFKLLSINKLNP